MKLKKILIACLISIIGLSKSHSQEIEAVKPVLIEVDLEKEKGEMNPVWAWFGYDEPNYTYMQDGKKLLTEISQASPAPARPATSS